jgi:hypothetical protein
MTFGLTGVNFVIWISPERYHDLVDNTVYGARATMTTDAVGDAIPFLDFVVDNFNTAGPGNNYGQFAWVLSVDGNASAIGATPTAFDFLWAPNAVATPQWTAGAHDDAAADPFNDPRYQFRIIDANAGIGTDFDAGTICISSLEIYSVNHDAIQTAAVEYNAPIDSLTHFAAPQGFDTGSSASIDDGSDSATITTSTSGDSSAQFGYFDASLANLNLQLYPVQEAGSRAAYRTRISIRAATSTADPVDALFLAMDKTNSELGVQGYTLSTGGGVMVGAASPQLAAADYEMYFMNQAPTNSGTPDADRLRGLFFTFNTDALFGTGTGGDTIVIESYEIDRLVNFMP